MFVYDIEFLKLTLTILQFRLLVFAVLVFHAPVRVMVFLTGAQEGQPLQLRGDVNVCGKM